MPVINPFTKTHIMLNNSIVDRVQVRRCS